MFGTNPIRKIDQAPEDGKLAVQEIFYTIQGEGPLSGVPAVFIRLAGCHLACRFCDTEFESGMNNRMTHNEIVEAVLRASVGSRASPVVVLTGGEPMRQNIVPLLLKLRHWGLPHMQIETAGNLWVPGLDVFTDTGEAMLVCSPKTSQVHNMVQDHCDHWKYVVQAGAIGEDGLPTTTTQNNGGGVPWRRPGGTHSTEHIWLSPMDEHDPVRNAANVKAAVDACMKHGYRLSLQVHKILGMP